MKLATTAVLIVIFSRVPSLADARTWYVTPDSTGDALTIQPALDMAEAGDDVLVAPGSYPTPLTMKSGVWLHSEGGASLTEVEGSFETGRCISCVNCDQSTTIEGFEIKEGRSDNGAGIYCLNSSLTISNNIIVFNTATFDGGGIYCEGGAPTIEGNLISGLNAAERGAGIYCQNSEATIINNAVTGNHAVGGGGGIYCNGGGWQIIDNTIGGNLANVNGAGIYCRGDSGAITGNVIADNMELGYGGGGVYCDSSSCLITDNIIYDNSGPVGDGIEVRDCSPTIENCTFVENGAVALYVHGPSSAPVIRNSIFAFNGFPVYCQDSGTVTLTCCDVYGNANGDWEECIAGQNGINGNFSADPVFCNRPNEDYSINVASPCAPGNHPDGYACGLIGALPVGCHMVPIVPSALIILSVALAALALVTIHWKRQKRQAVTYKG